MLTTPTPTPTTTTPTPVRERGGYGFSILAMILVASVLLRPVVASQLDNRALRTWSTIFVAVSVQALPFLALGVTLSGAIAALLTENSLNRWLPKRPVLAVPLAGLCGIALPGCECGSVPIAGRLMGNGVNPAVALTFLLAAPAVNPVVMVSTAVAFPNNPHVWMARFVGSMIMSITMGWLWLAFGKTEMVEKALAKIVQTGSKWERFRAAAVHDLLHAGGYLIVGAAVAAALQVLVPRRVLDTVAGNSVTAVITMAALAVLLSICSEADAFVASGLSQFSLTSRLVFMVVGPGVDLKLIAMQSGVFGRKFAMWFAPLTLVVAITVAVIVGTVML